MLVAVSNTAAKAGLKTIALTFGAAATLFIARNFFPTEKNIGHEIITDYAGRSN